MTSFDYVVLGIIGLSVLLAVLRGAISELLSLGSWILGFWLAEHYSPVVASYLPAAVPMPELRLIAGFLGILLAVWFVSAIIRVTVAQFVKAVGLAPLDRLIGAVFGVARGILISLALVIVGGLTALPREPVWRNAMFSPPLEAAAVALKPWLPKELSSRLHFE